MHTTFFACGLSCLMMFGSSVFAAVPKISEPIPLWPNAVPDEKGQLGAEHDVSKPNEGLVAGKPVIRLTNVSTPTITVYRPPKAKANGTAVLVCPGGGYGILAWDLEGTEICAWLNSIGVTGVLLKYRVPTRPDDHQHLLPLQDAQRALGLVRFHAQDWKLDPQRIGVLGFSAGGHLTARLSNQFEPRVYAPVDAADAVSCRPDFSLPIYPAYQNNTLAPELKVTTNTPPTFLVQAEDDGVHVENSLYYYLALKNAKVPVEMHLYPNGGHGYGLRPTEKMVTSWPKRAEEWLRAQGWLARKKS
jgi:acetyl esterase/lipase